MTDGVTNADGLFVIPCAAREVIARVTFVGYRTAWRRMRTERTTFENIDRMSKLNIMLSASLQIGPWEPRYSVGFSKQFIDGGDIGVTGRLEKPVWNFKLNNSLHLPLNLILGVNYRYTGRGCYDLYLSEGGSSLDLSLYRAFLKDRLTVRLNANDLFKKNYDRSTYQGRNVTFYRDNYSDHRCVVLTVRYSFNATKSKYKGTGAGNDEKSRL